MRLLLTGATGLVGRHVLAECLERGIEVHAASSDRARADRFGDDRIAWSIADLSASGAAAEVVRSVRPTHVIHAAWDTRHSVYWNSPENLAWLAATAQMAQAFVACGGRRFVSVGTCAEYDWTHDGPLDEQTAPLDPATLYGRCKLAAHHALVGAGEKLGVSAVTARLFFAYGPHENPNRLIPYICRTLAAGGRPKLSSGQQLRDLMHASDAARALVALAEDETLAGAVNLGSGAPVTLGDAARTLAGFAEDGSLEIGALPDRADDPLVLVPSVGKLFSIGWRPKLDLEAGLRETYEWWRARASRTEER